MGVVSGISLSYGEDGTAKTLKENHIHMYDHACMTTKCPLYAYRKQ